MDGNFWEFPGFSVTNACGPRPSRPMPELTPDALAKFEKEVTDEAFMERLLNFALRRKRARYSLGIWDGHLPGCKEEAHIVQEAIEDVLLGKREEDPNNHSDLPNF